MIADIATRASLATFVGAALFASSSAIAATLYTETNSASENQLQVYETLPDGNPTLTAEIATGGLGNGAGLGSQGALALSVSHRFVFAVNAGSNDVSSLEIGPHGLKLVSKVSSGGTTPISLTTYGDLLYVLMDRGLLSCYDAKTGELVYKPTRLGGANAYTSSPWAYDGKVFCLDENGETTVVQAGREYTVLHQNPLGEDDMTLATPAIAGKKLLIRTIKRVYCIE